MNLSDINETILLQLDPEVAKVVIEAQSTNDLLTLIGEIAVPFSLVLLFWVIFKYT
jgi:hypothetical protein